MKIFMQDKIKKIDWFNTLLWIWILGVSSYATYRMILSDGTISDYPLHLWDALNGEYYSIIGLIMVSLYKITGDALSIALFMGLIVATTGVVIRYTLLTLLKFSGISSEDLEKQNILLTILAYALIFIGSLKFCSKTPFYLLTDSEGKHIAQGNIYFGSFLTQAWHNSTYLGMRIWGVAVFAAFIILWKKEEKISMKEYLMLFLLLTITNLNKPNFILAFAPAVLVVALIDLAIWKEHGFGDYLKLSVPFIFSLFVLIIQYNLLFASESGNGIIFSPEKFITYLKTGYIWYVLAATFIFPVIVTVMSLISHRKNKVLILAWVFDIISIAESMLLAETGERAKHGNFGWNVMFAGLILFIVCIAELIGMYKTDSNKKWILDIASAILVIHFICGFMYFGFVFSGGGYFG